MIEHQIDIPTRDGHIATFITRHGSAFPKRPVYDCDAAKRHWERLLYRRNLGVKR
jgi:hypothetical protein